MLKLLNWAVNLMRVQHMKSLVFPAFNLSRNTSRIAFLIIFQICPWKMETHRRNLVSVNKFISNLAQGKLLDYNTKTNSCIS